MEVSRRLLGEENTFYRQGATQKSESNDERIKVMAQDSRNIRWKAS